MKSLWSILIKYLMSSNLINGNDLSILPTFTEFAISTKFIKNGLCTIYYSIESKMTNPFQKMNNFCTLCIRHHRNVQTILCFWQSKVYTHGNITSSFLNDVFSSSQTKKLKLYVSFAKIDIITHNVLNGLQQKIGTHRYSETLAYIENYLPRGFLPP